MVNLLLFILGATCGTRKNINIVAFYIHLFTNRPSPHGDGWVGHVGVEASSDVNYSHFDASCVVRATYFREIHHIHSSSFIVIHRHSYSIMAKRRSPRGDLSRRSQSLAIAEDGWPNGTARVGIGRVGHTGVCLGTSTRDSLPSSCSGLIGASRIIP